MIYLLIYRNIRFCVPAIINCSLFIINYLIGNDGLHDKTKKGGIFKSHPQILFLLCFIRKVKSDTTRKTEEFFFVNKDKFFFL